MRPMGGFDEATAVRRRGGGAYDVAMDPDWFVVGPNGGYVASVLLRALVTEVGDPGRPARSLTVHYAQSANEGPATVHTELVRAGKSMSFLTARLVQGDRVVANAMATFGRGRSDVAFQDFVPSAPPPERLQPIASDGPPIAQRYEYRPVEPRQPFSGVDSEFECWLRLREPRPVDEVVLATHVDAMFPPVLFRVTTPLFAPTVDLTVHFRRPPAVEGFDGWCLGRARTRTAADGFVEADCEIYDSSGVLLAQSRQLAVLVSLG